MKLASLKAGGRDGTLIVVDSRLTRAVAVTAIAPTLQAALEHWDEIAPLLDATAIALEADRIADAFPLVPDELASPLPRSFQFLDGSVYLHHMLRARRARGAAMPADYETVPLMYQGLSAAFRGPTEPMPLPSEDLEIDCEAEIAVILDDVPMGVPAEAAAAHIKLVMLMNDFTCRALTRSEVPRGFGFVQSKPTSSFSPVAVTPASLGRAWDGRCLHGRLVTTINGRLLGSPDAGRDMFFTYPQLIAHAARTRDLPAGTIIAAGAVSNRDPATGHGCIAEARVEEADRGGQASTAWLRFGDIVRIEMCNSDGRSIFGAIEQAITPSATAA
ncbi:MAG: fumarylacetoacetate hydrolase family protein [Gammaproteobacteria bacterium]